MLVITVGIKKLILVPTRLSASNKYDDILYLEQKSIVFIDL